MLPLRLPYSDDRGKHTRIRWWRADPSRTGRAVLWLWRPLWPVVILVFIPSALVILALFNGPMIVAMVLFSPFASMLIVVAMSLMLASLAGVRTYLRESASAMARAGECPSCGYRLDRLEIAPDGCSTCPECGSAWKAGPDVPPAVIVVKA